MVPTSDLTDRKSGRSLAITKNDAAQYPAAPAKRPPGKPVRLPLHTNYLRKITAGSSGSSMISHIFRKIIRIPLTNACTSLDERGAPPGPRLQKACDGGFPTIPSGSIQAPKPVFAGVLSIRAGRSLKAIDGPVALCTTTKINPCSSIPPPASANRINQTFCKEFSAFDVFFPAMQQMGRTHRLMIVTLKK